LIFSTPLVIEAQLLCADACECLMEEELR